MRKLLFVLMMVSILAAYSQAIPSEPQLVNLKEVVSGIEYPLECKKNGTEGKVYLALQIDEDGQIMRHKINSSPCKYLSQAVIASMDEFKFEPALDIEGNATIGYLAIPVEFQLIY